MSFDVRTESFRLPLEGQSLVLAVASAVWSGDPAAAEVADLTRLAVRSLPPGCADASLAFALNLLSAPSAAVSLARLSGVVTGGTEEAHAAGLALLGGHTLDIDALLSSVIRIEIDTQRSPAPRAWDPPPPAPGAARRPVMGLSQTHGCGAKLPPEELARLLPQMQAAVGTAPARVLVNADAGVVDLGRGRALAATVDVITPVTNDPYDYGAIAAAGALSDLYAKGASPWAAIAILGAPAGLDPRTRAWILEGGRAKVAESGARLVGLHELPSRELFFGLAAVGLGTPEAALSKSGVREGDVLVLTKALGTGVIGTIEKRTGLRDDPAVRDSVRATMGRLNDGASRAAVATSGVSAVTDVTGFSLAGHLLEMVEPTRTLGARLFASRLPLIAPGRLAAYLDSGTAFCSMERNRHFLERHVRIAPDAGGLPASQILFDAQTSGGLLIAVSPASLPELVSRLAQEGCADAVAIGTVVPRPPDAIVEVLARPPEPWP